MRMLVFVSAVLMAVVSTFAAGWVVGRAGIGSVVEPDSLTELEREFAERMQDVSLVGTFSIARPGGAGSADDAGAGPREDRYDIASVEKVGDDLWRFNARMDCCGLEGRTIPISVPLTFVGDTPMIVMTDTSLAGIGTFSVRLFFYGDRYAGTWQNGAVGGWMSGRIESAAE